MAMRRSVVGHEVLDGRITLDLLVPFTFSYFDQVVSLILDVL